MIAEKPESLRPCPGCGANLTFSPRTPVPSTKAGAGEAGIGIPKAEYEPAWRCYGCDYYEVAPDFAKATPKGNSKGQRIAMIGFVESRNAWIISTDRRIVFESEEQASDAWQSCFDKETGMRVS